MVAIKQRFDAVDIAKFSAAILVICIHCAPLVDINKEANFFLVQILARLAVPLFFMFSAFFFFKKIDFDKGIKDPLNYQYLKKYIVRLFKIYVIWSLIYLPFSLILIAQQDNQLIGLIGYVRDFFFNGSFYHLWFLPALMGGTVIVYICGALISRKLLIWIFLGLYIFGMLGNIYGSFLSDIPLINQVYALYTKVFVQTRNGIFFAPIFIWIGCFFGQHKFHKNNSFLFSCLLISFILLIFEAYCLKFASLNAPLTSMYFMLVPTTAFLGVFIINLNYQKKSNLTKMRAMTLLLYVSHCLFTTILIWLCPQLNSLIGFVVVLTASMLLSYVIVTLSGKYSMLKQLY